MDETTKLLSMSLDELDLEIGDNLLKGGFGMKPATDAEKRETARRWFEFHLERIRTTVCSNKIVSNCLLGKENKTRNELLAAVVDVLLKLGGWGTVPVAVISARIINYGLDKLCTQQTGRKS